MVSEKIAGLVEPLFSLIGEFLHEKDSCPHYQIHEYFYDLKKNHKIQIENFEVIQFRRSRPYSYEIEYVLSELIAGNILEEDAYGISLTPYGKKLLEKNNLTSQ